MLCSHLAVMQEDSAQTMAELDEEIWQQEQLLASKLRSWHQPDPVNAPYGCLRTTPPHSLRTWESKGIFI